MSDMSDAESAFVQLVKSLPLKKRDREALLEAHRACFAGRTSRRRRKFLLHCQWGVRHWIMGHSYGAIAQDHGVDPTTIRNALRRISHLKAGMLEGIPDDIHEHDRFRTFSPDEITTVLEELEKRGYASSLLHADGKEIIAMLSVGNDPNEVTILVGDNC